MKWVWFGFEYKLKWWFLTSYHSRHVFLILAAMDRQKFNVCKKVNLNRSPTIANIKIKFIARDTEEVKCR